MRQNTIQFLLFAIRVLQGHRLGLVNRKPKMPRSFSALGANPRRAERREGKKDRVTENSTLGYFAAIT